MNEKLVKDIKRVTDYMDKQTGMPGLYRTSPTATGDGVVVRAFPYTMRELTQMSIAGVPHETVRWSIQTKYLDDVQAGAVLDVGGSRYQVQSSVKDELNVEWTIFTRKMR